MNGAMQEDLSNGHTPNPPAEQDDDGLAPPTEAEVQTIIESIREASSGLTSPPRVDSPPPPPQDVVDDEFDEGAYWDLPSMAPLNTVSAVSI